MTKAQTISMWKSKLSTNLGWAVRGLLAVYKNQTDEEKSSKATLSSNGSGFTGYDADVLTEIAECYQKTGCLNHVQKMILFRRIPKYAGQLYKQYGEKK